MKNLLILFSLIFLLGCGTRKAELQRQINIYKNELQEQKQKNIETDSSIEDMHKTFNEFIESHFQTKEILLKEISELSHKISVAQQENTESFTVQNAVGDVKITDAKGNQYTVPSGAGTSISKENTAKLKQENSELREAYQNEFKSNESLQADIKNSEKKEIYYRETLQKKETEISDLNQKISDLEKSKNKKTESKRPSFAWYVLAFVLGMASLRFLQTQVPNFLQYLNNKR